MNRTLISLAAVAGAAFPILLDSSMKAAAILTLAGLVLVALRKASAATKHLVWLFAVAALIVLPLLSALLPGWRILPAWASADRASITPSDGSHSSPGSVLPEPIIARRSPGGIHGIEPFFKSRQTSTTSLSMRDWLGVTWAAGCIVLFLRLLAAHFVLRRASALCAPVSNPRIVQILEDARVQLGVRRPIKLLCDSRRTIPMIWGIFCPRLLVPAEALQWDEGRLRSVILHELAHVRRGDTATQWITQLACALHWFNPLVWFAAWRLHVESEQACDNLVLASGVRPSDYAEHLLHIATNLSNLPATTACGLAMARPSRVEGRLVAVLNRRANRRETTRALAVAAFTIGLCVVIPVSMLRADENKKDALAGGTPAAKEAAVEPSSAEIEAKAEYDLAVTQMRQAERNLARLAELRREKIISETEYAQAQYDVAIRQAELQIRNAKLTALALSRADADLHQPPSREKSVNTQEHDQARTMFERLRSESAEKTRAELVNAAAQVRDARTNLARLSKLEDQKLVSQAERETASAVNTNPVQSAGHSDPRESRAYGAEARAEVDVAKADLAVAHAHLKQVMELVQQKAAAKSQLEIAQAELARAEAKLRLAEVRSQPVSTSSPAQPVTTADPAKKQHLRDILAEEIKLAEEEANTIHRRMKNGVSSVEEGMRADREVLAAKRELALVDHDTKQARELIDQQIGLLNEWQEIIKRQKRAGQASQEDEFKLRREILNLQRQRLELE